MGIHLGDLTYLHETRKQAIDKNDLSGIIAQETKIARAIDEICGYQNIAYYNFEEMPQIKSMLCQEKFIPELQSVVEDQQYSRSYQLEPKLNQQLSNPLSSSSSSSSSKTSTIRKHAPQLGLDHNMDLISITVDEMKQLSLDKTQYVPNSASEARPSSNGGGRLMKLFRINSHGNQLSPTDENQITSSRQLPQVGIFETKELLKEGLVLMREIKEGWKYNFKGNHEFEEYFLRLFPHTLYAYPKKPLNSKTNEDNGQMCTAYNINEQSNAEIVASDHEQEVHDIVRLRVQGKPDIIMKLRMPEDALDWLVHLQKSFRM